MVRAFGLGAGSPKDSPCSKVWEISFFNQTVHIRQGRISKSRRRPVNYYFYIYTFMMSSGLGADSGAKYKRMTLSHHVNLGRAPAYSSICRSCENCENKDIIQNPSIIRLFVFLYAKRQRNI